MRLTIDHTTTYNYEWPAKYALQQVRKRPRNSASQNILNWEVELEGARLETSYIDHHGNHVDLISAEKGAGTVSITCRGEVETLDTSGVVGPHAQAAPLWIFRRETSLTKVGRSIKALIADQKPADMSDLSALHVLAERIAEAVTYEVEQTTAETTADEALQLGRGVCQDHAHIFISAARLLGYPARYVSGYLMMMDRVEQDAGHAWAEVYVEDLGWTGFDVSNRICPDARYIRVASGLDYRDAAPINGLLYGAGHEDMAVAIQVQQQTDPNGGIEGG